MSLKIKGWRKIIKWLIWLILAALLIVFLVCVLVFENQYYNEKEGSEREVVVETDDSRDLIEEEPSDEKIKEYQVAADRPRYLSIDKLGIKNARVLPMGVNSKGELDTPRNIFDVGWYDASGKPGAGGTLVIDGHNGGPTKYGVFKRTPELSNGDIVVIERGDGAIFKYQVVENVTVNLVDANVYMRTAMESPEKGKESVTLITCTGDWSADKGTYLSRQFTRAVLIEE